MLKPTVTLILMIVSSLSLAKEYDYELKGTFQLETSGKKNVIYSLRWSEKENQIEGIYTDNTFAPKFAEVSGSSSAYGRTFQVLLPQAQKSVRSITLVSSVIKETSAKEIPVGVVTRDLRGNPLTSTESASQFVLLNQKSPKSQVAQLQEDPNCQEGFGVLAGFCGVYAGILEEDRDPRNKCNLLLIDAVRLELSSEGMVILHLGEVNDLVQVPSHVIGRIPFNPQDRSIDLIGRICGELSGVNSSSMSCKRVHLAGDFTLEGDTARFAGKYRIAEEESHLFCEYSLSMNRQL